MLYVWLPSESENNARKQDQRLQTGAGWLWRGVRVRLALRCLMVLRGLRVRPLASELLLHGTHTQRDTWMCIVNIKTAKYTVKAQNKAPGGNVCKHHKIKKSCACTVRHAGPGHIHGWRLGVIWGWALFRTVGVIWGFYGIHVHS